MRRVFVAVALSICLAAPVGADELSSRPVQQFVVYAGDALFARPATLGVTLAGATVWAVTLPFTYFARDSSTFDVLVRGPAEATFTRCLGCGLRGRTRSLPLPSPR